MKTLASLALAVLSGVLLPLALPNEYFAWGNPALGLICLSPLYLSFLGARDYRGAFVRGALFGGLAHGLSSYWLWFFQDFRFWTLGSTVLAYMLVYGALGLYLYGCLRHGGLYRPLLFAAAWAVFEWSKSNGFLGYPWGLLPYTWNTVLPAIQIAESTGVYGLGFTLAWISAALGELAAPPMPPLGALPVWRRPIAQLGAGAGGRACPRCPGLGHLAVAAVLLFGVLAYGSLALAKDRSADRTLRAVIVQQNTDSWSSEGELKALEVSMALSRRAIAEAAGPVDLILFSETVLRRDYDDYRHFYRRAPLTDPLLPFLAERNLRLLTGAPELFELNGELEATNSVILIGPDGRKEASYAKMHPVPFAEAIPFWEYAAFRSFMQEAVGLASGWIMGSERVIFSVPSAGAGEVRFGAPICFEDAFSYLCRRFVNDGAELLINLTNDSWSMTRSAEIQHYVAAMFRAVELRRTLVRSTNGGVSAVVLPDGRSAYMLPLFEAASVVAEIPVYTAETTPYLAYGDWFPALLALFLAASALILSLKREDRWI